MTDRSLFAAYPGVVIVARPDGDVVEAWAGVDAPLAVDDATGRPLHRVLGLADDDPETGALQLWLACCDRVGLELWRQARQDPPARLQARVDRPALALDYGPVMEDGEVTAVAVFARLDPTPARATSTHRAVLGVVDPLATAAFARAAADLLIQCDAALARLRGDHEARAALHRLFRAIHTIKGEARAAGQLAVQDAAHAAEHHLAALREADRAPRGAEIDQIATGVARIRTCLAAIAVDAEGRDAMTAFHERARPVLSRLQRGFERWQSAARNRRCLVELDRMATELVELAERSRLDAFAQRAREGADAIRRSLDARRVPRSALARIEQVLDQLDLLLGLYQQVHLEVVASDHLAAALALFDVPPDPADDDACAEHAAALRALGVLAVERAYHASGGALRPLLPLLMADAAALFAPASVDIDAPLRRRTVERLHEVIAELGPLAAEPGTAELGARATRALRECAEDLTHVPLDDLMTPLTRGIYDVAADLGKQVDADIDVAAIGVPPTLRQHVTAIALHAIRNAIDHGVEDVEARVARGKPPAGKVRVRVAGDDELIAIEIVDDGRGIDVEAVRLRAVERGLIPADEARACTTERIVDLVFHPGFTTASSVTAISGRGVGMDVIRSTAEELGGRVMLQTLHGVGTRLRVEIPYVPIYGAPTSIASAG